jgi:hypothetical protein
MAYNRWLVDFCAELPGRRCGQALVSFDDIEQCTRDIAWAKEHGLGGIVLPGQSSVTYFDPALDPVWAACQDLEMTVSQHGGVGGDRYQPVGFSALMTIAVESGFFSTRSLWQMILGGVFDRFPELKVAFIETQLLFVTPVVTSVDKRLAASSDWMEFAAHLGRDKPFTLTMAEYVHRNCTFGVSPFSAQQMPIDELVGKDEHQEPLPGFHIGADNAMFGVDYPHFESVYDTLDQALASLVGHPSVTAADATKILFDNALGAYHFDRQALEAVVEEVGIDLEAVASV